MTALTWQTMLLLGLAYFAGCWIACVVRRTIGARSTETVPATRVATPLQEVSPRPAPQPVTVARQPQPEPVPVPVRDGFRRADTLEPSPKAAAKPAPPAPAPAPAPAAAPPAAKPVQPPQQQAAAPGAPSATRFERALSGEGTAAARPAAAPAPVSKPVASEAAPVVRQPEPPKPQAAPPQPVPAPAARPPAPAPAATTNVQRAAAAAGAVATAVSTAAAATQANPTVRVPAPSAPVPPQPPAKPPAAAAAPTVQAAPRPVAGQPPAPAPAAAASAPPAAAAAATPQVHDDLRRIRAIDAEIASALNRLGITRYAQIAAWKSDDVARINRELGSKNRVEQENWIEQAQMLARGEETFYARRLSRGELPRALPVADEGAPRVVSAPSTPASPPQPVATGVAPAVRPAAAAPGPGQMQLRAGGETAAAAAAALAAAAASRSSTTAQAPVPQAAPAKPAAPAAAVGAPATIAPSPAVQRAAVASTPASSPAPQTAIRPAPAPAPSATTVTPPEVSSRAAFARGTPVAPVPTATEKAPPQAVSSGSVPVVSARPAQQPVESQPVRAAVGTSRDDLQRIEGINAEIERLLNGQGITRYSQIARWGRSETERFDRLLGRPGRIAGENWVVQAERLAGGGAPATPAEPSPDAPRSQRLADAIRENQPQADESDAVHPRSSDISGLRSVRSEAFRGDATGPGSVPAVGTGTGRTAAPDDLKRIRGIGVLIEKKLNSMGITSYGQIANWSSGDVDRVSEILDFKGRIERENWVEQARILAAGGQTEFSRRADRGDLYGDR